MSVIARRHLVAFAAALAGLSLAACSGDETPGDQADAGEPLACESQDACADGTICISGICTENKCAATTDCPDGWTCDVLTTKCKAGSTTPTDGGTTDAGRTDAGPVTTDGGTPAQACTDKWNCPAGQICKNRKCQAPAANDNCANDQDCPSGKLCNFSKKCESGCIDPRDCSGDLLCHPTKYVCETCSLSNPCPAGKSCVGGKCQAAVTCTGPSAQECVTKGLDGAVCVNGTCQNCGGHSDCAVDPYKDDQRLCTTDGLCKKITCTDQNCQQSLGARGYCNTSTNQCAQRECLADTDCTSPKVCNTASNTCQDAAADCNGDALAQCQQQCMANSLECNPATCACGGGGTGTGTEGAQCVAPTDCATGYTCALGICTETVADASCVIDLGITQICTGCTGAATGRECDNSSCLFLGLFNGLLGGGGGGASCTADTDCAPGETCEEGGGLFGGGGEMTCKGPSSAPPCY